ncbi:sensor histidine kinase [Massilia consociata]|uniref:Sensor histidine kinase n=1 Tax=Massilia consociata TaxID=760117 RepID=A0ABV6FCQ5_9BURK
MRLHRGIVLILFAWVLFWTLMVLVAVEDFRRDGEPGAWWQPVLWETSSMLVITALALVHRRYSKRHDALIARPWRWFALQACWLPLYWAAFTPLVFGLRHLVYAWAGATYEHEPWSQVIVYESLKITVFIGLFTVIAFGLLSWRALLEAQVRAERAHAGLREAQLARLTQQMQPHFLFNALNTVSSLMHTDLPRADATVVQLADVLRATLTLGDKPLASLADELRIARGYAAVMAARFDDRVTIAWDIDEAALDLMLPAMSLQPLLENVFKHTVERRRGPVRITVGARRLPRSLLLWVEDDAGTLEQGAPGAPGAPSGIGVSNLRTRLASLYGDAAQLSLTARDPAGVRAEMRIPCAS